MSSSHTHHRSAPRIRIRRRQSRSGWLAAVCASGLACTGAPAAPDTEPAILVGRVVDGRTGVSTACTVEILDAEGHRISERDSFPRGFRSDGVFTKHLPPGLTRVRITRGFETLAVEQTVELKAGESTRMDVALERVVDLRRRGWYAGDSHAHMVHGERTVPVDFDDVALAARAEDLHYLSLAHAWVLDDPTPERLEAELGARSKQDCRLTWNLEAPKNYYRGDAARCLGHCWSVGMRGRTTEGEDVIAQLRKASAGDYESTKPMFANFESHRLIHDQGGSVFYTHPMRWWTGAWGGQGGYPHRDNMRISNMAVELPLDTLLGPTYDGLDVMTTGGEVDANAAGFRLWAMLLNHGYRLAATGSSDACFDRPGGATPGAARTYTYLEEPFSVAAVAQATAAGRTMVTTGPLALVSIDGRPPGSVFPTGHQPCAVSIEVWPSGASTGGLARIEWLRNGEVLETFRVNPQTASWNTHFMVRETETAWYCVRVFGQDSRSQRAVTGAFHFQGPDYKPPAAVPIRVRARIVDAATGKPVTGRLTEVFFHGPVPRDGASHLVDAEGAEIRMGGTGRLRAEADGYDPLLLSPFFDHEPLLDLITHLEAEDLLKWETFERVRELMSEVRLTFALQRPGAS